MERDLGRLRELYADWKTEDLKRAISFDRVYYEPWEINIIKDELRSRNEDLDSFQKDYICKEETFIRQEESLKNEGKLFCPKCHSLNIIKKKWKWWYFLLIPIFGAYWLLFELFNLGFLQLPLCFFLVFMFLYRMKYRCDDCSYYFGQPFEKFTRKLLRIEYLKPRRSRTA